MAELILSHNHRGSNPRIDLTPMVDLGFLLITFFIFTTTLTEPKTMDINMPLTEHAGTEIPHHTAMTILLGKNHQAYYFSGTDAMNNKFEALRQTKIQHPEIREMLMQHALNVQNAFQQGLKGSTPHDRPFILIKAGRESQYGDLIHLLDELMISNTDKYAIMDISMQEEQAMAERGG